MDNNESRVEGTPQPPSLRRKTLLVFFAAAQFLLFIFLWCASFVCGIIAFENNWLSAEWVLSFWALPPLTITAYLAYRKSKLAGDWLLLTLYCYYTLLVGILISFQFWQPDIHYLRGNIYSGIFMLLTLAIGFVFRIKNRETSISMSVYYLAGILAVVLPNLYLQWSWTQV